MKIQSDTSVRVVALTSLAAMLDCLSGAYCQTWQVGKVTANRVQVIYSNEDEYANECPLTFSLPCYPSGFDKETPSVILDFVHVSGGRNKEEREDAWQLFEQVQDWPILWRNPENDEWQTEYEIRVANHPEYKVRSTWDKDGCIQTWFVGTDLAVCDKSFRSFREASDYAAGQMATLDKQASIRQA